MLRKGLTLIELLIVIAILGILTMSVLSAINPLEQMKKARDARRKSDAVELLYAYERYFTAFTCYPWENSADSCSGTEIDPANVQVTAATFRPGGINVELLIKKELKVDYLDRETVKNGNMFITESIKADTLSQVSVCFEPESQSARSGGLGQTMNVQNTTVATCNGSYHRSSSVASCFVCIPQ